MNLNASAKTKAPACCNLSCCGNHFGRIDKRNPIKKTRRYAKRAEKNLIRKFIRQELE